MIVPSTPSANLLVEPRWRRWESNPRGNPSTSNAARSHRMQEEIGPARALIAGATASNAGGPMQDDSTPATPRRRGGIARHGHTVGGKWSPTYQSWSAMIARCTYPSQPQYPAYGGRGITVCPEWRGPGGFDRFLAAMGERPEGLTLDRIDNDGNYEPGNCRWASASEQQTNKRPGWHRNERKTHCPAGHPYDAENTYVTKQGYRLCRVCHRDRERERRKLREVS